MKEPKKISRVEKHLIKKSHNLFKKIDEMSFTTKNLYNYANYLIRQVFITTNRLSRGEDVREEQLELLRYVNAKVDDFNVNRENNLRKKQDKGKDLEKKFVTYSYFSENHKYMSYEFVDFITKENENYGLLMAQTAQQTLKELDSNWKSFFESIKDWRINPHKYKGIPKIPKYKDKKGRGNVCFTNQSCKRNFGYIKFPKCLDGFLLKTKTIDNLQQVRIKPLGGAYVVEVVTSREFKKLEIENKNIASIDLGLDNFATITNNIGEKPVVINGRTIKSFNQYYNKKLAKMKSSLKKRHNKDWSNKLDILNNKRYRKIQDYMHKASRLIISWCTENNIDTLVVGKNDGWKQKVDLGKKTNQKFVQIPHSQFVKKLEYKCQDAEIKLILAEESYTSGTSFLDNELPDKENYNKSRRVKRGLFKSDEGILINADVNGSYQIMKKVFPKAFADGIEGVGLHPVRISV